MRQALESLRRAKRRWLCFDRRIKLRNRPALAGWTGGGSPLFDCSWPVELEIPSGPWNVLSVTLFTRSDLPADFDARLRLESTRGVTWHVLRCRPNWRRYPLALPENGAGQSGKLTLSFEGPSAEELRLGELKLERHDGWQLRSAVQGVSYPRSGHHMAVDVLQGYFGSSFQYCGYSEACGRRPCADGVVHLQKNHDHDLDLPADEDRDYLVQYRHPLPAIVSYFEHKVRHARAGMLRDGREDWEAFATSAVDEWRRWMHKWVLENTNPRAFHFGYEEAMVDPQAAALRLLRFFDLSDRIDPVQVRRLIRRQHLTPRRTLAEFRYYDAAFFHSLEASLAPELRALRLDSAL